MSAQPVRDDAVLQTLSDSPNALPSPSAVALELMRALDRRDVGLRDLAALVRRDPALTARLIQLANSAIFSGLRPAVAVEEAVIRIGTSGLARIAVAISLIQKSGSGRAGGLDLRRFWVESIQRGLVFQHLAARLGRMPAAEAFSLGLLADIGLLAMAVTLDLDGLPGPAASLEVRLLAQRGRFGFDQTDASAALLRAWGFPPLLAEAVRQGEFDADTAPAAEADRSAQLRLCVRLCRGLQLLPQGQSTAPDAEQVRRVAAHLHLAESDLHALLDAAAADLQGMTALFDLPLTADEVQAECDRLRQALAAPPVLDDPLAEHVLVVSADAAVRADLRAALASAGHAVLDADRPALAQQQMTLYSPRVVVLDWDAFAPEDSAALCRDLRARQGPRLYLLALSRSFDQANIIEALGCGANDVLSVPVLAQMLLAKVETGSRATRVLAATQAEHRHSLRTQQELERRNAELLRAAGTDELTGLANRRALDAYLQAVHDHAEASGQRLACLMFDLDHFKQINDHHGHDVGDRALLAVARVLRAQLRAGDLVARVGGEEFLMLCPGVEQPAAVAIAERIRDKVAALAGDWPPLTVSAGVAIGPIPGHGPLTLLRAADQALLQAKRDGRNRVSVARD